MPLQKTRLAAVSNSISLESHSELYRTGFYIVLLKQSSPFNKKSFSCLMLLQRSTWIRFIHKCARSQTLDFDLCADNNTDGPSLLSWEGFISKSCETTEQFRTSSQRATAFLHLVCAVFKMYLVLHSWKGWYLTSGLITYSAHKLLIALVFLCMSFGEISFQIWKKWAAALLTRQHSSTAWCPSSHFQ